MAALLEYDNIQDAVQASMRTASRAADDLNDPKEIQRIVAEQDKAREAEQKLNQADSVNEWLRVFGFFFRS